MSCSDGQPVVRTHGLGKCYHVYRQPQDRLRQFFARRGTRHYTEFWALRDLDLEVRRGETMGILGKNGAGKSTLLQLIAGTLQPTTGHIEIDGRVTALLELGSGFHHDFSGRENVYLAGAILGFERQQMDERMEQIVAFADIGEFLDRPVKTYSKGMFARLSFSVYANLDPDIFIVDEALAVGDAKFRHKCMHRFRQMQEQGVSILYVSHDAPSMKHICDRAAWIESGALRAVGEPNDVVDDYLTDLFHSEAQRQRPADAPQRLAGDERAGSRRCTFSDAKLTDISGRAVELLSPGEQYLLTATLVNHDLDPDSDDLNAGFWVRNPRGLTLTATSTHLLDGPLRPPARGQSMDVKFTWRLPPLTSGSYAVTLNASTPGPDGEALLCERVVNALHFRVANASEVPGLVAMDCRIEAES